MAEARRASAEQRRAVQQSRQSILTAVLVVDAPHSLGCAWSELAHRYSRLCRQARILAWPVDDAATVDYFHAPRLMVARLALSFRCPPLLAAAMTLALSANARADIFHFVDQNGVTHYTNVQPVSGEWRRVYHTEERDQPAVPHTDDLGAHRMRLYDAHIKEAAVLYQLPEPFIRAVILVESDFRPDALSEDGAMGLMQLPPETALDVGGGCHADTARD
jgi:soluble lytic murein transglycosylase-like protein